MYVQLAQITIAPNAENLLELLLKVLEEATGLVTLMRLQEDHLNLVTRMYLQKWWTVHDFPYNEALDAWHKAARCFGGQFKA